MQVDLKEWLKRQVVLVLIGGHAQRLLPYLWRIYPFASYAIIIDSPKDIDHIKGHVRGPRIRLFSLGVGHTAQTLCKDLPPHVLDHIKNIGGMSASAGMGQSILVGRQAGKELVESPDFKQFVDQELIPVLRDRAGGSIDEVRFIFLGSGTGGTFTGAELPVANKLSSEVRAQTSAVVQTEFLVTGALTYDGLGDRIWQNGAASVTELLAYVSDPKRDARDVRSQRLIEFAMCGIDEALRDAFLAQLEQAAHCVSVEYELERGAPNRALNGKFGNIQIWEAAGGKPLDFAKDIRPVIADAYVKPLKDVLERKADPTLADHLEVVHTRITLSNSSVDEILEAAVELPATQALADLKRQSFRHSAKVLAHDSKTNRFPLDGLSERWAKAAKSIEEVDLRISLQRRLLDLLKDEVEDQKESRLSLEEELVATEAEFSKQHALLNPVGVIGFVKSALKSTTGKLRRLKSSAYRIREITDELSELLVEEVSINRAQAAILSEYSYLERKLSLLVEKLTGDGEELGVTLPSVVADALDARLPNLWDAIDGTDIEFADAIRGSVSHVTLSGIAKVTGASAPRPEEIAKLIVSGRCYSMPAPPWGGRTRADQGKVCHVLPPASPETQSCLLSAVKDLDPTVHITFADAAPVVVNIVGITMRLVRKLCDDLTEPYKSALYKTLTSPCVEMFHPEGIAFLDDLGIEIRGNELVFKHYA